MITTQKHITEGLYRRLRAAGIDIWSDDGVLHSTDDAQAQQIIDGYTVAEYAAERQRECALIAKRLRDSIVGHISAGEMASWPIKRDEARAYAQSGNPADAPLLAAEAQARGITLAAMMDKVAANAASFAALEAAISGADGLHRDNLAALTSWAELTAYDLTAGWPEV